MDGWRDRDRVGWMEGEREREGREGRKVGKT